MATFNTFEEARESGVRKLLIFQQLEPSATYKLEIVARWADGDEEETDNPFYEPQIIVLP